MVQLIIIMRLCNNINCFLLSSSFMSFLFEFFLFSIIIILSLHMYLMYQLLLRTSYLHHSYMQIISMNILLFITFFHLRMFKMIYFLLWRELISMSKIRWVCSSTMTLLTDPYHLYLYCFLLVKDDEWVF